MHAQTRDLPFQVAEGRPESAALPAGFTTDRHLYVGCRHCAP